jgi:O-6-methylguanine DNA methyltransferase
MISLYTKEVEGVWFGVTCDDKKVFATGFGSSKKKIMQDLLSCLPFDAPFQQAEKVSGFAERVIGLMKGIYDGKDVSSSVPLTMDHLPDYTQRVLKVTMLIPSGYVASYGAVAKTVGGNPRSVGSVMASNPFAPIVPCHRVVGSDFSLVGYGGGLANKLAFLKREKKGFTSKREISVDGRKLIAFPAELALKKAEKK